MKPYRTLILALMVVVVSLITYLAMYAGPAGRSATSADGRTTPAAPDPNGVPIELGERDTFYLIPHIARIRGTDPRSLQKLKETLDFIEPGGAHGKVQLGFMAVVPLYDIFEKSAGEWVTNTEDLEGKLQFAARENRPVVVYIKGNHFAHSSQIMVELAADRDNLMSFRDGSIPSEIYFTSKLNPATLSTDPAMALVRRRQQALEAIGTVLVRFEAEHPGLLQGVLLNGETHHLFRNFYSGTGTTLDAQFTDYSPRSLANFDAYLDARGSTLQASDILTVDYNHFDAGTIKIEGWVARQHDDPLLSVDDRYGRPRVNIYINGKRAGSTLTNLNRLDVYEAIPDMINPNAGFSFNWDYRAAAGGTYGIQAVLELADREYEIGHTRVTVRRNAGKSGAAVTPRFGHFDSLAKSDFTGYLDAPKDKQTAIYSEVARHWLDYRAQQIVDQVNFMGDILAHAGVSETMIYTYQLTPWLVGRWNAGLFGVGEDFFRKVRYRAGVTAYGGNTLNPAVLDYLPAGNAYAVAEWHTQLDRSPLAPLASLKYHYDHGAKFVSPYYFEFKPDWEKYEKLDAGEPDAHSRMLLTPANARMGSDHVYLAVKRFAAY